MTSMDVVFAFFAIVMDNIVDLGSFLAVPSAFHGYVIDVSGMVQGSSLEDLFVIQGSVQSSPRMFFLK